MDAGHDLSVLAAMAAEVGEYLRSDVLLWQLQAPDRYPKLSLGQMLLVRARVRAFQPRLPPREQQRLARAEDQMALELRSRRVAAETKARIELSMRLNLWEQYLAEAGESVDEAASYPQAVTQRVIAALLLAEFPRLEGPEAGRLPALDLLVQPRFRPGAFIWEAEIHSQFPQPDFWFLYGRMGN